MKSHPVHGPVDLGPQFRLGRFKRAVNDCGDLRVYVLLHRGPCSLHGGFSGFSSDLLDGHHKFLRSERRVYDYVHSKSANGIRGVAAHRSPRFRKNTTPAASSPKAATPTATLAPVLMPADFAGVACAVPFWAGDPVSSKGG